MFSRLRKWIRPPSPVELGMSKYNSLPSKRFNPFCEDICWEDWREEVKKDYPIRYFISEVIPHYWAVKVTMPIFDFKWKVIDFFRRPHLLDTRNREYKGGYVDPSEQFLYAGVECLRRYLFDERGPTNYRDLYSEQEIDQEGLRDWQKHYDECWALWNYWVYIRPNLVKKRHQQYLNMEAAAEENNKTAYDKYRQNWISSRVEEEKLEKEFMEGLLEIRRGMWT